MGQKVKYSVLMLVNKDATKADCETYHHRIGRTGHFGKHGLAINLVDSEKSFKHSQRD